MKRRTMVDGGDGARCICLRGGEETCDEREKEEDEEEARDHGGWQ